LRGPRRTRSGYRRWYADSRPAMAWTLLGWTSMETSRKSDPLTWPLLIVLWTTLLCAFVMVLVVVLMR